MWKMCCQRCVVIVDAHELDERDETYELDERDEINAVAIALMYVPDDLQNHMAPFEYWFTFVVWVR